MTENRQAMILPASSRSILIELVSRFFQSRHKMAELLKSLYTKSIRIPRVEHIYFPAAIAEVYIQAGRIPSIYTSGSASTET